MESRVIWLKPPYGSAAPDLFPDSSHDRSMLNILIRAYRVRIDPNTRHLGPFIREAKRVGRPPSQEELSEALGVSRQWYASMELYSHTRVSVRLLARLSEVLMLSPPERDMLFKLAMPELSDIVF